MRTIMSIIFFFFLTIANTFAESAIKWALDDWEPFHKTYDNGKTQGLLVDLVNAILIEELKLPVEYHQLPWKRCQSEVEKGELDFLITVATPNRLKYTIKSDNPILITNMKIYTYKNHPRIKEILKLKTLDDLIQSKLRVITYLGDGWFKANMIRPGLNYKYTSTSESSFKMLSLHRADIIINDETTTNATIKKLNLEDEIVNTRKTFMGDIGDLKLHFLISKKSPYVKILERFNTVAAKLSKNGTFDNILAKYDIN